MTYPYEIHRSPLKTTLLLLIAVGFVVAGFTFLFLPGWYDGIDLPDLFFRILGIVCILFFGGGGLFIASKLRDPKPAILIDERGITDRTTAVAYGLIPWEDITSVEPHTTFGQHFVLLNVADPEAYVDKAPTAFARRAARQNLKLTGSPIALNPNGLKMPFKELLHLVRQEHEMQQKLNLNDLPPQSNPNLDYRDEGSRFV